MLEEFAKCLNASKACEGLKPWDSKTNHIQYVPWFRIQCSYTNKYFFSCLAHVINLASQAFIAGYSKTKYFNPEKPDDHNLDINAPDHDAVGLVQAINVKVMSKFHCTDMYWQWLIHRSVHPQSASNDSKPCKVIRRHTKRCCSLIWEFDGHQLLLWCNVDLI